MSFGHPIAAKRCFYSDGYESTGVQNSVDGLDRVSRPKRPFLTLFGGSPVPGIPILCSQIREDNKGIRHMVNNRLVPYSDREDPYMTVK